MCATMAAEGTTPLPELLACGRWAGRQAPLPPTVFPQRNVNVILSYRGCLHFIQESLHPSHPHPPPDTLFCASRQRHGNVGMYVHNYFIYLYTLFLCIYNHFIVCCSNVLSPEERLLARVKRRVTLLRRHCSLPTVAELGNFVLQPFFRRLTCVELKEE